MRSTLYDPLILQRPRIQIIGLQVEVGFLRTKLGLKRGFDPTSHVFRQTIPAEDNGLAMKIYADPVTRSRSASTDAIGWGPQWFHQAWDKSSHQSRDIAFSNSRRDDKSDSNRAEKQRNDTIYW